MKLITALPEVDEDPAAFITVGKLICPKMADSVNIYTRNFEVTAGAVRC
jgi:hypothetical protein